MVPLGTIRRGCTVDRMADVGRSWGAKLEHGHAREVDDRSPVQIDRGGAALIALFGLYTVFFGTPTVDWVWYALALVLCAGWLLWRSMKERRARVR